MAYIISRPGTELMEWFVPVFLALLQMSTLARGGDGDCSLCGPGISGDSCWVTSFDHCLKIDPLNGDDSSAATPGKPRSVRLEVNYQKTQEGLLQARLDLSWMPPLYTGRRVTGFVVRLTKLNNDGSINKTTCKYFSILNQKNMEQWRFRHSCFGNIYFGYIVDVQSLPVVTGKDNSSVSTYIKLPKSKLDPEKPSMWNTYVTVLNDSAAHSVDITFGLAPKEYSFIYYKVMLMTSSGLLPRPTTHVAYLNDTESGDNAKDRFRRVIFNGVCPGSYLVWILPQDEFYYDQCLCRCRLARSRCGCDDSGCATTYTHGFTIHGDGRGGCWPPTQTPASAIIQIKESTTKSGVPITMILLIVLSVSFTLILTGLVVALVNQLRVLYKERVRQGNGDNSEYSSALSCSGYGYSGLIDMDDEADYPIPEPSLKSATTVEPSSVFKHGHSDTEAISPIAKPDSTQKSTINKSNLIPVYTIKEPDYAAKDDDALSCDSSDIGYACSYPEDLQYF